MQAAVVVNVAVADDQRLDLARIDLQELDVVDQRRGRVAEVEHDGALLLLALRFQEQRQAPLIVQDVAGIGAAARPRAPRARHRSPCCRAGIDRAPGRSGRASTACRWSEPGSVARSRSRRSRNRRRRGCRERGRGFQEVTPFEIVHVVLPGGASEEATGRRQFATGRSCPRAQHAPPGNGQQVCFS